MKFYLKLVDFEMKRFLKMYAVLIGLIVGGQSLFILFQSNNTANNIKDYPDDYKGWKFDLSQMTESIFYLPIMLCICGLLFYIFFTWYREWFGKNTFAYQMLLLPFNRMAIFYAKLTSLLLFVFGFLVVQIAMFPILNAIFKSIVPKDYVLDTNVFEWIAKENFMLNILIPTNSIDFITFYSLGTASVIVLFTMIVLERSFRLKGIGMAVLYGVLCVFLLSVPLIISALFLPVYGTELFVVEICVMVFIIVSSLVLNHHLLNKKVWV